MKFHRWCTHENLSQHACSTFEVLIGILATALIVAGLALYVFEEPERLETPKPAS